MPEIVCPTCKGAGMILRPFGTVGPDGKVTTEIKAVTCTTCGGRKKVQG